MIKNIIFTIKINYKSKMRFIFEPSISKQAFSIRALSPREIPIEGLIKILRERRDTLTVKDVCHVIGKPFDYVMNVLKRNNVCPKRASKQILTKEMLFAIENDLYSKVINESCKRIVYYSENSYLGLDNAQIRKIDEILDKDIKLLLFGLSRNRVRSIKYPCLANEIMNSTFDNYLLFNNNEETNNQENTNNYNNEYKISLNRLTHRESFSFDFSLIGFNSQIVREKSRYVIPEHVVSSRPLVRCIIEQHNYHIFGASDDDDDADIHTLNISSEIQSIFNCSYEYGCKTYLVGA